MKLLYDTNILIDFLIGDHRAQAELTRSEDRAISAITWMEVMVGSTVQNEAATRAFLRAFTVIGIDPAVQGGLLRCAGSDASSSPTPSSGRRPRSTAGFS